ncbi:hypothetical protein TNCV_2994891 [Trichonephila clavipes]|nr:hypothetical protein TNCV_2994891 [Trichonephila clavipes]
MRTAYNFLLISLIIAHTQRKKTLVVNVVPAPFDYVGDQKRMVLLPEEMGEKDFLESRFPTFRIDSSKKGHPRGPVLRVPTGGRSQKRALDITFALFGVLAAYHIVYIGTSDAVRADWTMTPVFRPRLTAIF